MPNEIPDFQKEVRSLKAMAETNEQEFEQAENQDLSVSDELAAKEAAESFRESLVQAVISLSHKIQDFKESKPEGRPHKKEVLLKIKTMEMDLWLIMNALRPEMDKELAHHKAALTSIKDKENNIGDLMDLIRNQDPRISKPAMEKALKIAGDPKTPDYELEWMAEDTSNTKILTSISSNPATHGHLLIDISQKVNLDNEVKIALLSNRNTPLFVVEKLMNSISNNQNIIRSFLTDENTPVAVLMQLIKDPQALQRLMKLAENPQTSAKDLDTMSNSKNHHLRMSIAKNPNTPIHSLISLLNPEESDNETLLIVRQQLLSPARAQRIQSHDLIRIEKYDHELLGKYIKINPKAFGNDTIARLTDSDLPYTVMNDMVSSLEMPVEALFNLSDKCQKQEQSTKNSPSERIDYKNIRLKVEAKMLKLATNPKTAISELEQLLVYAAEGSGDKEIRRQALHNLKTMAEKTKLPDDLYRLATVDHKEVKLAVIANKNTPGEIILGFCNDQDAEVKNAASSRRDRIVISTSERTPSEND